MQIELEVLVHPSERESAYNEGFHGVTLVADLEWEGLPISKGDSVVLHPAIIAEVAEIVHWPGVISGKGIADFAIVRFFVSFDQVRTLLKNTEIWERLEP